MDFYYLNAQNERTRASQDDLKNLVSAGVITSRTLVWWEDLPEWVSCGEVRPGIFTLENVTGSGASVAKPSAPPATPPPSGANSAVSLPFGLIKAAGIAMLGVTAVSVLSIFLMPLAWIPLLMGIHLFKASGEAEGIRSGDPSAVAVYEDAMGRFWKIFLVGAWFLALALLILIIYALLGLAGSVPFPSFIPKTGS